MQKNTNRLISITLYKAHIQVDERLDYKFRYTKPDLILDVSDCAVGRSCLLFQLFQGSFSFSSKAKRFIVSYCSSINSCRYSFYLS